jgi:phage N-6-adenine-methyltransferase
MSEETRHYDSHDAGPEWGTPKWIVDPLSSAVGGFTLDPASGAKPEPYAENRFVGANGENGLERDWFGHVWLNPPYGREHNKDWAEKTFNEAQRDEVKSITALVPASMETNWFQSYYGKADYFTFIDTRVKFHGAGEHNASFPSVIVTFWNHGRPPTAYMSALAELGLVADRNPVNDH